mgnify:CR=1 FL=1
MVNRMARRPVWIAAAAIMLALLGGACGGGGEEAAEAPAADTQIAEKPAGREACRSDRLKHHTRSSPLFPRTFA